MKATTLIKPYFIENRVLIFCGLLCLIIVDLLQLFIPRILKWAIDDLTALQIDLVGLFFYSSWMVGIALLIGIFRYFWRRCLLGTSRRVEEGLRNKLFSHIQILSASYFDQTKTGDLMAHATNDIQQIRMATGMGMVALNDSIVLGMASIGFMAYINLKLTLLVLIPMPLIVIGTLFFSRKMHQRYLKVQGAFSDLTEVIRERFAGIRIVKAYNLQNYETKEVEAISKKYVMQNLSLVKIVGSFFPMMLLFTNISLAIVLYFGGRQAIALTITPGDFVAFISYLGILTWPMMALGWVTNLIQRGRASLDRLNRILQVQPEIASLPEAMQADKIKGGIHFKDVSFSYKDSVSPALSKINIDLPPGKILGIVGPPGSGKTTLLSLIPRLYDVSAGQLLLDKNNVKSIQVGELRSLISYVPQEPFLFAGTVKENITLGSNSFNQAELDRASSRALLYKTVQSFPHGFDTVTGEKGVILSGGQKQRIALARAFLRNTPILILDDPISQVDLETGSEIIKSIMTMAGSRTIIIVSHRLSAVRFADQIITLDKGSVVESGTHDRLMETNQYYSKTFRLQEIEEELDAT
ncbi:MAG: ABC transporter ATP-binding protein/permease [Deltaproteobacteria bacterium]|nr:ABC transporter ATP-binding protein/permease [Deltaproteobacteria bacterium]